jgi:hypothetical protein
MLTEKHSHSPFLLAHQLLLADTKYLGLRVQHHAQLDRILINPKRSLPYRHGFNHATATSSEDGWKHDP